MSQQNLDKFWKESIKHLMVNAMISSTVDSNPVTPFQAEINDSISSSSPANVNSTTNAYPPKTVSSPGNVAIVEMTANLVADIITNLSTSLNQIQSQQQQPKRKRKRRRRRYSLAQRQKFLQKNSLWNANDSNNGQYSLQTVVR